MACRTRFSAASQKKHNMDAFVMFGVLLAICHCGSWFFSSDFVAESARGGPESLKVFEVSKD